MQKFSKIFKNHFHHHSGVPGCPKHGGGALGSLFLGGGVQKIKIFEFFKNHFHNDSGVQWCPKHGGGVIRVKILFFLFRFPGHRAVSVVIEFE